MKNSSSLKRFFLLISYPDGVSVGTFHMSANTKIGISNVAIASTLVTNSPRIQIWKSLIQYLTTVFHQVAMEKRRKNSNLARLSFFLLGALLASAFLAKTILSPKKNFVAATVWMKLLFRQT